MRIAICITTFQRAAGLQNLLMSLTQLRREPELSFTVIVVDNDAAESAQCVVRAISPNLNYPVTYVVEPRPGLTYARNTALEHGLDADAIAFLDDDEEADPSWLIESVNALNVFSADIVTGPVLSRFIDPPADWIVAGGFFDRHRPMHGTVLTEARTGNVCIRTDVLRKTSIRFDDQFALSGGEDADFFRRLHAAGFKIVASDTAIVHETVSSSRTNARWIFLRALRITNANAHSELTRSSSPVTRLGLLAGGCARIVKGAAAMLAAPMLPKHVFMRHLQRISRGLGMCMASIGLRYDEYKRKSPDQASLTVGATARGYKELVAANNSHESLASSPRAVSRFPQYQPAGIRIHAMTRFDVVNVVAEAIARGRHYVIANHNLHGLYCWFNEPKVREFHEIADYTHIDGMSLILLGWVLGLQLRREHRTGYVDLLPVLAEQAAMHGWRVFYLGSKPGVADRAAMKLRTQYPGLQIRTRHGHFDPDNAGKANQEVLADINTYAPHILLVGMGMPRQETWIFENRNRVSANAVFCCGALMDYIGGEIPTPPRWIGMLGFEWLFRLASEPTRLWRRYLLEPWFVLEQIAKHYLRNGMKNYGGGR